jgi:hypothetical protein
MDNRQRGEDAESLLCCPVLVDGRCGAWPESICQRGTAIFPTLDQPVSRTKVDFQALNNYNIRQASGNTSSKSIGGLTDGNTP